MDTIIIRMNYSTLLDLFKIFPKIEKEGMAAYFIRLNRYLKGGLR